MAMRRPTGQERRMIPEVRSTRTVKRAAKEERLPLQSEKSFQAQVLKLAQLHHWRAYHSWTSLHSSGGFPDLVLVRRPRVVFAELKREDRGPTDDQIAWLEDLKASGQEAYLWKPSSWSEIEKVLR